MNRFVGERRALAAAVLVFYAGLYAILALAGAMGPEWTYAISAMGAVYGIAFFALVAGYFWARWFAIGVALSGLITGLVSLWQLGPEPIVLFLAGTHLAAVVFLWGSSMAAPFDGQTAWRERFHIDDNAAHRLGRAVIRAGISLPYVLMYALAPRPGAAIGALAALALTCGGVWALVRLRTWGVLAMAGAAGILAEAAVTSSHAAAGGIDLAACAAVGAIALAGAVAPFVRPSLRHLRA
jgi:hypothetical protein